MSQGKTRKSAFDAKEIVKMTRNVRRINNLMDNQNISKIENNSVENVMEEKELPLVHESCNYSNFSFAVAVSGLIAFMGILIYALVI